MEIFDLAFDGNKKSEPSHSESGSVGGFKVGDKILFDLKEQGAFADIIKEICKRDSLGETVDVIRCAGFDIEYQDHVDDIKHISDSEYDEYKKCKKH